MQQTSAAVDIVALLALSEVWSRAPDVVLWRDVSGRVGLMVLVLLSARVVQALETSVFSLRIRMISSTVNAAIAVADDLREHTGPEDRVFYYAHDAHGLLYAERLSAIPYYVDMLVNLEVFIEQSPPADGMEMTDEQEKRFDTLQKEIWRDSCDRLMTDPPAAIVIAPRDLGIWSMEDTMAELGVMCPPLPSLMAVRYQETRVGEQSVYYRDR